MLKSPKIQGSSNSKQNEVITNTKIQQRSQGDSKQFQQNFIWPLPYSTTLVIQHSLTVFLERYWAILRNYWGRCSSFTSIWKPPPCSAWHSLNSQLSALAMVWEPYFYNDQNIKIKWSIVAFMVIAQYTSPSKERIKFVMKMPPKLR